ncbi:hypothetical protein MRX96_010777 [Rhipicephalus microplus]
MALDRGVQMQNRCLVAQVTFTTKIYHPNVSDEGDISLGKLHWNWSPQNTVGRLLLSPSVACYASQTSRLPSTKMRAFTTRKKFACSTQSTSSGPICTRFKVFVAGAIATTTTGHPATAEPSKAAAVQPGSSQSPQDPSSLASSPKTKSIAQRRLSEELADLARDPPPGCSAHLANCGYPVQVARRYRRA